MLRSLVASGAFLISAHAYAADSVQLGANDDNTASPIKHVIVIVGENRTFDHLFGTYQPKPGQTVSNILSKGIVTVEGQPGPHFADAIQRSAQITNHYEIAPARKFPYATLPPPGASGASPIASDTKAPPFKSLAAAAEADTGLFPGDLALLLAGATGLPSAKSIDTRILNVMQLPSGPFPLTPGLRTDSYAGSPVHRFFQMWQQMDCASEAATPANPSGCLADLFPWVEATVSAGGNGNPPPADADTHEGAVSMGFYNLAKGDAPYLKQLADDFSISDNYHQPVMGGTGANSIYLGFGDALYYAGADGKPAIPPSSQIENPDPQNGTNNVYVNDGYGDDKTGFGGSYTNCADPGQPGVGPILGYLKSLKRPINANCEPSAYYLVNNYNPAYIGNGTIDPVDTGSFTLPPSHKRHIGDALNTANVSWRYYGEGWTRYLSNPNHELYCNICNPIAYTPSIMTDRAARMVHLTDLNQFYADVDQGFLPAVSFVKPNDLNDGHPASSRIDLFESFTRKLIEAVRRQPKLWGETSILVTVDEGGGYWDSGYVQPLDFFGDGPRLPLIVVSPYSSGGRVVHTYYDHVSVLKFIERNWKLGPISERSRDNLPNPIASAENAYVPINSPAIGDLFEMFVFPRSK